MTTTAPATRAAGSPAASRRRPSPATAMGWGGVALGLLAFLLALPPLLVRTVVPSALLALGAVTLGVLVVRGGRKRLGYGAIVAGVLGFAGAVGATRAAVEDLEVVVSWGALTAAMLRFATPLTFAALGGLVSERAGVVNIGLEGMMLMGAFFSAWAADATGSWPLGILLGMLAGVALAAIHAVFSISLRTDQIVTGTALNFLALGITGYLYIDVYGTEGTPDDLPQVPEIALPIEGLGFLGQALSNLNLLVWGSLVAVALVWFVIFRTAFGLRLRSVGENPRAAETVGINVYRMRYIAVLASGGLAALGGAFLAIGFVHAFSQNMTAGRGFIALAALIFGRWLPLPLLLGTLLFGFSSALAQRLPEFSSEAATLFQALPYVLTLVAVAGLVGRSRPPAADGIPYRREDG